MRKIIWIPLVILLVGAVLAGTGWAMGGHRIGNVGLYWQDGGLHLAGVNSKGEVGKLIEVDETFKASDVKAIDLNISYLDNIVVKEGDAGSDIRVRGANYEESGGLTSILTGDTLSVSTRKNMQEKYWVVNLGIMIENENCYIEITVPKGLLIGNMNAKIGASKIEMHDLTFDMVTIDNDYGDIEMASIKAEEMQVLADAGKIDASSINITRTFKINNDYGNIKLNGIDAGDIEIEANAGTINMTTVYSKGLINIDNDFGDVTGSDIRAIDMSIELNSGLVRFDRATSDTATIVSKYGDIKVDRFTLNGHCEVESAVGAVYVGLTNSENEVGYDLNSDVGNVSLGGRDETENGKISQNLPDSKTYISIKNDFGNIKLEFGK